jgi:signal transduction histidine kinase
VERLREAVDNLVSNAVKYSPIGGRIDVSARREDGAARIRVVDEGPGFLPEDAARLFGRFQRLSAKPTGGESSTGLGLSITKRIIDLHNGRIFVESAGPNGGAHFNVVLPLMEGGEAG